MTWQKPSLFKTFPAVKQIRSLKPWSCNPSPRRDVRLTLALVEGQIHAGRNFDKVYKAVGIAGNKITILGPSEKVRSACDSKTKIVNLHKRALIPGFIDAHTHFIQMGVASLRLDLSRTKSLRTLLKRVERRCKLARVGEWILGSGWDESKWPEKRYPTSQDLTRSSSGNPVWLRRIDGHMGVANELALHAAHIQKSTRGYGIDESGVPTGILREDAMDAIEERVQPDEKTIMKGLRMAVRMARRLGVTSIHDMAEPEHIRLFRRLAEKGRLGVRVYLNFFETSLREIVDSGQRTGEGDDHLRLGALKLFADGSLGAHTAALREPYADSPEEKGMLIHPQGRLTQLVKKADSNGIQLSIHCIGEKGIDAALRALEEGCSSRTLATRRHRLEHFELVEPEAIRRAERLRLTLSMQPNYVDQWSRPAGMYSRRLGRKRLRENNPFRKLLESGLPIAFGSDCMPFAPLYGVYSAVNAPIETQRLTVRDAITCYTAGGAYGSFEEHLKGTIEVGKLADLVALSDDPFENPEALTEAKVDMTVFDGRVAYIRKGAEDLNVQSW